jgi:hypothetical protein
LTHIWELRGQAMLPVQPGFTGVQRSSMPASEGVRFPFRKLQPRHEITRLSQLCRPPRWRGTTWSSVRSRVRIPQY